MVPKKNEQIYFAQSQGGGLIVDDKKNNIKFIVERSGRITKLFGSFSGDSLNFYDMRDARMIADRVLRLLGRDNKYTDYHYFLKGYHVSESFIKSCSESLWADVQSQAAGSTVKKEDDVNNMDIDRFVEYLNARYDIGRDKVDKHLHTNNNSSYIYVPIGIKSYVRSIFIYRNYNPDEIEITTDIKEYCPEIYERLEENYDIVRDNYQSAKVDLFIINPKNGKNIDNNFFIEVIDFIMANDTDGKLYIKRNKVNESLWADVQSQASGATEKEEDAFAQYTNGPGRLKLMNLIYDSLKKIGYDKYIDHPKLCKVVDAENTSPWLGENDGDEEFAYIGFGDVRTYPKFTWSFTGYEPETCELTSLSCGPGLKIWNHKDYEDAALVLEFVEGDDEHGNPGNWQTLEYSYFEDTWFWSFNSFGELKPKEVDEFMATIIYTITPILNKTTQYTRDFFPKDLPKSLNESVWSEVQSQAAGDTIKAEDGTLVGSLPDGTNLVIPPGYTIDGEIVKFDDGIAYQLDDDITIVVVNKDGTDTYFRYDEDAETVANLIESFTADDSLRNENEFGALKAVIQTAEWYGGEELDGLEVDLYSRYSRFTSGNEEYILFDDHDNAEEYAYNSLRDTIDGISDSTTVKRWYNLFGDDVFNVKDIEQAMRERFDSWYDDYIEFGDAVENLIKLGIVEETDEYFEVDEDGDVDTELPKFDPEDYREAFIEKQMDDIDDVVYELISDLGYSELGNYLDYDKLTEEILKTDGIGSEIASYDGEEREVDVDGTTYYIYRT